VQVEFFEVKEEESRDDGSQLIFQSPLFEAEDYLLKEESEIVSIAMGHHAGAAGAKASQDDEDEAPSGSTPIVNDMDGDYNYLNETYRPWRFPEGTLLVESLNGTYRAYWKKCFMTEKNYLECSFQVNGSRCKHSVHFSASGSEGIKEACVSLAQHIEEAHKEQAGKLYTCICLITNFVIHFISTFFSQIN